MPSTRPRSPSPDQGVRRKMRKGTHSCFECRRRKIRCIYTPDRPSVCSECFARGSQCVDQEHAPGEVAVDQRKNLRERVARLEAIIETLLAERPETSAAQALSSLRSLPTPSSSISAEPTAPSALAHGSQGPLLSMFDNVVLSRANDDAPCEIDATSPSSVPSQAVSRNPSVANGLITPPASNRSPGTASTSLKKEQARAALLRILPPRAELMALLEKNGQWWIPWRSYTTSSFGEETDVTITAFASRVLASGEPVLLGSLVLCYAACLEQEDVEAYMVEVDRWVISDDEFMASVEGLECLLLKTKICTDNGQPRRGWITAHRGMIFAQLLGLRRETPASPKKENIWWILYIVDRFLSLLLGLPCASTSIQDDMSRLARTGKPGCIRTFERRIAIVAGKIVDRNQALKEPSYSSALDVDQELETIAADMPKTWWDLTTPAQTMAEQVILCERMIDQLAFHQVRLYLHLPFMLKSAENSRFEYSRSTCFGAAREMLRIYHLLKPVRQRAFYECKVVDFLAFTAAIVVFLGLMGYGRLSPQQDSQQDERDWAMLDVTLEIFKITATLKGGGVAAQSHQALALLCMARNMDSLESEEEDSNCSHCVARIVIPYFGTISVSKGRGFNPGRASGRPGPNLQGRAALPTPDTAQNSSPDDHATTNDPSESTYVAYDGLYSSHPQEGSSIAVDSTFGLPMFPGEGNWWQNPAIFDLNQDWGWLVNDGQNSRF